MVNTYNGRDCHEGGDHGLESGDCRVSTTREFVTLASREGANLRVLCRHYGISPRTVYKWLARYQTQGAEGLAERSRRPCHSPDRTPPTTEQLVLEVRQDHPAWGGRKIKAYLERAGHPQVPAASTITAILRRHAQLTRQAEPLPAAAGRFQAEMPNALWQMDFKGHFALTSGQRCHPLTVLDDYSRFLLGLQACADEHHPHRARAADGDSSGVMACRNACCVTTARPGAPPVICGPRHRSPPGSCVWACGRSMAVPIIRKRKGRMSVSTRRWSPRC